MNYRLFISPLAQEDIEGIYRHISKDDVTTAKKQVGVIYDSLENLLLFPKMGANLSAYTTEKNDYKFLSIKKTYTVFYKIVKKEIRVIRVLRCEQDYLSQLGIK